MNPHPVNILLVDDQPGKLLSYETILADLGENLIRANSGKEALEQLLKNEIAVVLVDVCMPEMDGFELASMIRGHPRFQKTAIILVSGVLVEDVDRLRGYDSGAVDYVSVPIVPEILRAKVEVFADLFRKTQDLERLNQELEQRVAERTAEIEAAAALLRENEERLRLALTTAGIQAWTWDIRTNEVTWVQPAGQSGQSSQPLADCLTFLHPDDRALVQNALDRAIGGDEEFSAEFRTEVAAEERWWLGRATVIRDSSGQPLSMAGINIDITGQKRAQEERAVLLKNAQDARRELEKASQLKDEFLANLSHELRTPLNAIVGWAHMLRTGELDQETQAKAIETINRNALLQTQLISDILDVSRIVSGKLRLNVELVNLPSVIQAALDTVRLAAQARNVHIDVVPMTRMKPISGDPARLQQVVWNLLSNAIKFTPPEGHVQIRLEKAGSEAELTIQDDGPGIPPDLLPYIFERFRQGDSSSTRAHQGLGLGLAIVRHLVEMHGGRVHAMNRQDRSGAIFRAVLPLRALAMQNPGDTPDTEPKPPWPEDATQFHPSPSLKGARVLVVDDEADARDVAASVLELCGAHVVAAGSASEAIGILERERPNVVVADIQMAGEDGYALLRKIRALPQEKGGQIPAVALTAYASPKDREKALDAGFQTHVAKPIQPRELVTVVANLAGLNAKEAKAAGSGEHP